LNTAHFENEVLHLTELMIPNLMSSTMNLADLLGKSGESSSSNNQGKSEGKTGLQRIKESGTPGRPEKDND